MILQTSPTQHRLQVPNQSVFEYIHKHIHTFMHTYMCDHLVNPLANSSETRARNRGPFVVQGLYILRTCTELGNGPVAVATHELLRGATIRITHHVGEHGVRAGPSSTAGVGQAEFGHVVHIRRCLGVLASGEHSVGRQCNARQETKQNQRRCFMSVTRIICRSRTKHVK